MPVPINYWAVLVAAIVNFVLGFLWYGPIFGKYWTHLMGWTKEHMEEMMRDPKMKTKMYTNYIITFIGSLLIAFVLAHALVFGSAFTLIYGVSAGLMVGFWNWLGFIAPITLTPVLWEGKSWKLWVLNAGYYLVALLVMGVILAVWK